MKFEVYSIVLGGTDSLLEIKLPNGYEFRKIRASETPINKKIRNLDGDILVQYLLSDLGNGDAEFICIYKCSEIDGDIKLHKEKAFREVEKIITLLQIFKLGCISLYNVFYVMPQLISCTSIIDCNGYVVGDKYVVSEEEHVDLQDFLCLEDAIYDKLYILMANYFNSTKFIDCFMQLQYLVTMGELLVLERKDKKQVLFAKRLALLVENTNEDKKMTYKILHRIYELRSNWVHEGNDKGIDLAEVNTIRKVVSRAIKSYILRMKIYMQEDPNSTFKDAKTKIIKDLKEEEKRLGDEFFKQ